MTDSQSIRSVAEKATPTRVRFAPSPTGYLHVGGARTALFNWLFARHFGGKLVLRIEDTDMERSSAAMVTGILEGMQWLGMDWDEGPFHQSERLELYRDAAHKLLETGHAYHCFCTREELELRRATAAEAGETPRYDGRCRHIPTAEAIRRSASGEPAVVRFRVPQSGVTEFHDAVFGHMEFVNAELEDFVLLRSDGIPTYHLSVVVDDIDMQITHVIRGADHLSNTPKQVLQYRALGASLPVFAHLPLILGPDKTRLSKRHGATSVMAYRDMGIIPEAFRNFLAVLGWSPGEAARQAEGPDREIFSTEELIRMFSLDGISHSNAVFNNDKLAWYNTEYIRRYQSERLLPLIEKEWKSAAYRPDRSAGEILAAIALLQPRARNLKDFASTFQAYFGDKYEIDSAAAAKFISDASLRTLLAELGQRYGAMDNFNEASAELVLREFAAEKGLKAGALINGARVLLTGQSVAPSLFAVMTYLGRDRVARRLQVQTKPQAAQP
ncbi:MAG TPA: glutamate--tRNA ligase [Acidobacteriaceae bacterium]|nr:glutamate--tRNA ligase [Acidobacteriaceae bacterium]